MPNIKTSAKNRKQLNKLFSLNYDTDAKNSNQSSVMHSTRTQSPDHYSESGVFSLSEYDQSVKNHKRNTNTNSDYFSNPDDSPFNTKPKLLRSNSKPKFVLDSPEPPSEKQQPVSSNKNSNNSNNVEIVGKKLMSNGNGNGNVAQSQAYASGNNNSNSNNTAISQKKKAAALKS